MNPPVLSDETQRADRSHLEQSSRPAEDETRSFLATHVRTVLAASGFFMLAFVVLHMAGNLLVFAGGGTFNAYARSLRDLGAPVVGEGVLLWTARIVLAAALALHLAAHGYLLLKPTSIDWELRSGAIPPWYATLPAIWLQVTGGLIAAFLVFHLLQLTIGSTHPAFTQGDSYHNLVVALGFWPVSIAYVAASVAVGAHLIPGIWTGMRSLGLIRPSTEALAATLSTAIPFALVIGLSAVPVAVLIGVIR